MRRLGTEGDFRATGSFVMVGRQKHVLQGAVGWDVVFPGPKSRSEEAIGNVRRKSEGKEEKRRRVKHPQEPTNAPDSSPEKKGDPPELRVTIASRKTAMNNAILPG